jgi:hypothetical protein
MSEQGCGHVADVTNAAPQPNTPDGCEECLAAGGRWVHLRLCVVCGHIGCCDNSPGRHATGHFKSAGHPLIRSYEPGEDWWFCYTDDLFFEIPGADPAPSYA